MTMVLTFEPIFGRDVGPVQILWISWLSTLSQEPFVFFDAEGAQGQVTTAAADAGKLTGVASPDQQGKAS